MGIVLSRASSMLPRRASKRSTGTRPAHHANDEGTLFRNPWPSAEKATWTELMTMSNPLSWYNNHDLDKHPKAQKIEVVKPDWGVSSLMTQGLAKENSIVGTWLGHAGALVELPIHGVKRMNTTGLSNTFAAASEISKSRARNSLHCLFDPIFSMRAGPSQYTGPCRMRQSPCQVSDLSACDAVFISHNHYDHLDLDTIKALLAKFPDCRYFVPLGNKSWFVASGVSMDMVFELDWWDTREYTLADFDFEVENEVAAKTIIRFTCVPAQHNSGRGATDHFTTLWSGWVIEQLVDDKTRRGAIYHAGDTGYRRTAKGEDVCPIFENIAKKFKFFDLSFIPIWRGGTLGFISYLGLRLSHQEIPSSMHTSPKDAIDIHKAVNSRNTVGVHFGTFIGSENESWEATIEFEEAREKNGIEKLSGTESCENGRAGLLNIGGSVAVEISEKR